MSPTRASVTKLGFGSDLAISDLGDRKVDLGCSLKPSSVYFSGKRDSDDSIQFVATSKQKRATFVRKVTIRRVFSQSFQNEWLQPASA